ncbi:hypothetical protein D9M71_454000 [compost metagenome]
MTGQPLVVLLTDRFKVLAHQPVQCRVRIAQGHAEQWRWEQPGIEGCVEPWHNSQQAPVTRRIGDGGMLEQRGRRLPAVTQQGAHQLMAHADHQFTDMPAAGQQVCAGGVIEPGLTIGMVDDHIAIIVVHVEVVPKIIQCVIHRAGIAHQVQQRTEDPHPLVQAELEAEQRIVAGLAGQFQHQGKAMERDQRIGIFQRVAGESGSAQQRIRVELLLARERIETMQGRRTGEVSHGRVLPLLLDNASTQNGRRAAWIEYWFRAGALIQGLEAGLATRGGGVQSPLISASQGP